jgi:hypothetical protein
MSRRERLALALAAMQAADLAVTLVSSKYGTEHLQHLRVPAQLRPALPVIKCAAVAALVLTARRPAQRSAVGAALVSYYSAAVTFHMLAGDPSNVAAPAAACGVVAAALV